MDNVEKIVTLDNEVQAQLLNALLTDREVPHVIRSYHDSALDGIFQMSQGWGHVEAPAEFREAVLATLEEMKQMPPTSDDDVL